MQKREEILELIQEELPRILTEVPHIRYTLIGVLSETFVRKDELVELLEAIKGLREDFNRGFAEHSRRLEEHSARIEELSRRLEEHSARIEEHSRRLEEHSERLAELTRSLRKLESTIGGIGARWGILAESAFREGLAGILADEFGVKVERYVKIDTTGEVFGRPEQVEIDVAVCDEEHILMEIKSSMRKADVYVFFKKASFYEREEEVKVKRMIIVSPFVEPDASAVAKGLGIEVYTSAYEVRF